MSYEILWEGNNSLIELSGDININDLSSISNTITTDSRFIKLHYTIYDYSKVQNMLYNSDDIEKLSNNDIASTLFNNNIKIAIVTASENIIKAVEDYAIAMIFTQWQIKWFATIESAKKWCAK